ncbi:hypothetical protein L541_3436 [Bordetella hinzii CA90 BAL1384]|uniref:Uncharacterized protein n=1 Tax=Bordetella hinzii OH87 BAL007II TaxID=1331262 RepID=A0ABR4QX82_9BORD|nr:hypothetical protein L544_3836 [Bordetella hinzii OH87 BAL007II]KCB28973.1 hypothetical protein L541_3436 [Bordetella hinzii CA90 BAL1384]KCB40729.1 hypothetical protein L539_3892 [Bordetella hinzii 5132]KCB46416.1 hypothetical protein L538_3713 [Bordetella hinzii 4161]KCB50127.1 hypothetical protein L537_3773 [Bordetella hinzii 1277]
MFIGHEENRGKCNNCGFGGVERDFRRSGEQTQSGADPARIRCFPTPFFPIGGSGRHPRRTEEAFVV